MVGFVDSDKEAKRENKERKAGQVNRSQQVQDSLVSLLRSSNNQV